jgi:hypothetical protein
MRSVGIIVAVVAITSTANAMKYKDGQVTLETLDDYDACQDQSYSGAMCHDALTRWVTKHRGDAFKAGKMTRLKMNHYNAIPFFVKAFENKAGDCKDEDLKLAIIAGLGLAPDDTKLVGAKKLGFTTCAKELQPALVNELSSTGYYADNVCGPLQAAKALSAEKSKFCAPKEEAKPVVETLSAGDDRTVNPYGQLLKGEGIEVEIATFEDKNGAGLNDVLVRMKGAEPHNAGIDGKVVRLVAVHGGSGVDYKFVNEKGEIYSRISGRKSWGDSMSYEVHFANKSIAIAVNDRLAKTVSPSAMLSEFAKSAIPKKK